MNLNKNRLGKQESEYKIYWKGNDGTENLQS